jgi:hypothetical protein
MDRAAAQDPAQDESWVKNDPEYVASDAANGASPVMGILNEGAKEPRRRWLKPAIHLGLGLLFTG